MFRMLIGVLCLVAATVLPIAGILARYTDIGQLVYDLMFLVPAAVLTLLVMLYRRVRSSRARH